MGKDATVLIVIEKPWYGDENLYVVYVEETQQKPLTDAIGRIKKLNQKFNFKRIICDYTGLGIGAVDSLKEEFGFIVEGISFTIKSKMDLYGNLKILMQKGKLKIPNHKKLLFELADMRYEVASNEQIKLHHSEKGHDDYCDALALAAWYFRPGIQGYEFPFAAF